MKSEKQLRDKGITRRSFLRAGLAAGAALPLSPLIFEIGMSALRQRPLPQRRLGRTDIMIPVLGLGGAWWISETDETDRVEQILNEAIAAGIKFFDTYPGRCQKHLSMITSTRQRSGLFIAGKIKDRTYDGAMRQFESNLKELCTDSLDLVQIHHINRDENVSALGKANGVLAALRSLREQKAIRFIGMTGHPEFETVKECIEMYDDFDTFMCFVNPTKRASRALEEQVPAARRKNIGIIAMKVFGGRDPANLVGEGSGRASSLQLLRFALGEDITVAIPAVSSLAQLRENIAVARNYNPLSAEERRMLVAQVWSNPCSLHDE